MNKLQEVLANAGTVARTYPAILLMSAIMSITIVLSIEYDWEPERHIVPAKIILVSALGISLMFALKMLSQRSGREVLWLVIGTAILVGYYFILPSTSDGFTEAHVYLLVPSFILSHLMVAFLPYLQQRDELRFWQYNKNLFINLFLTAVFTGVMIAGVLLAILAVQELFGADIPERIYGETFALLSIFGSTFIFLVFSRGGLTYLEQDGTYPVVLKFFTQFILIPLLLIYLVILYFYTGKIILEYELPEGWVTYLVLAYALVGIFALLLVHPLKDGSARSWVRIFSRIFYYTLLPLVALLFTAIFTRLLEYGFTEARYFVLLLAIWLLCVVLYFMFLKKTTIRFIPVSLFVFGLFALAFPYLNAFSVAKRSQKNELEKLIIANQLIENGTINFEKSPTSEAALGISDKFDFLNARGEYEYLRAMLPDHLKKDFTEDSRYYVEGKFKNVQENLRDKHESIRLRNASRYTDVAGYRYVIQENNLRGEGIKLGENRLSVTNKMYGQDPEFYFEENGHRINLLPALDRLCKDYHRSAVTHEVADLSIGFETPNYQVKVIFSFVEMRNNEGADEYYVADALYLIREKG